MINIAIVSYHFDTDLLYRPYQIYRALKNADFVKKITVISSDFDHIRKCKITNQQEDVIRISVPQYSKNISIQRLLSYWSFSNKIKKGNWFRKTDLVIVAVPDYISAISIIHNRNKYSFKLLIDVVDLWPEALPLPSYLNAPIKNLVLPIVGRFRRWNFEKADRILLQSHHFKRLFGLQKAKSFTVPMCGPYEQANPERRTRPTLSKSINILLLGSINNITDICSLILILKTLSLERKVRLSVIGGGQSLNQLKDGVSKLNIETVFYGITFDSEIKKNELSLAHFGYNGYKKTTEVAVTYKSMEYLRNGLPLLNSVSGDTHEILDRHGCGINYTSKSPKMACDQILNLDQTKFEDMESASRRVYNMYFSYDKFRRSIVQHSTELTSPHQTRALQ